LKRTFENGNPEIIEPFTYDIKEPRQQVSHLMARAKYQYFFNDHHKIAVSYTFQKNNREEYDMGRLGNVFPSLDLQLITHQLLTSWELRWNDLEMKYGIALDHQENTFLGRFFIPNYLRNKGGLFAIFEKTKLRYGWELGLRTDMAAVQTFRPENQNIIKEDFHFQGNSIAFSTFFKWNEDVTSFLTVGSRFRMPDMNELFSGGLHHGVGALEFGDMTMQPERSYSISIPNIYNHNNFRVNVEPFYHHFNNYIYLVPTSETQLTVRGAFPVFRYQQSNVNYAGMDADMQYNLSGKWLMFLGGQFIYVKDRASNAFIYGIAPPSVRGRVTYNKASFLNLDQFFITTKANVVTFNRWVSVENDFAPPPDAYCLLGIELGGYLKDKPFFFSFGVNNLLNTHYRDYLNRYRYFADEQGINLVFTAKYQIRKSKLKNFKNDE
jgi:iron complex outermembrane receptor protein